MSEIYSRQTDWRSTIQHKDENKLHECEVNATQAEGARYHAPLLSAATAGKGSAPVRAATLQAAQRLHGNRSVQRSIHGSSSNVAVQRMARFDGPLEEAIRLPGHGDSGSWQDPTFGPNRAGGWGDWGPWGGTNPGGHGDWGGWQDPTFGPGGGWGGGFGGGWQDP